MVVEKIQVEVQREEKYKIETTETIAFIRLVYINDRLDYVEIGDFAQTSNVVIPRKLFFALLEFIKHMWFKKENNK